MKLVTHAKEFALPVPYYASLASSLRECGLEFEDDDHELLDLVVKQADVLLDMRLLSS